MHPLLPAPAVFCVAEVAFPRSFLISCGRVASILMQGVWFLASARMLFEGELSSQCAERRCPGLLRVDVKRLCSLLTSLTAKGSLCLLSYSLTAPHLDPAWLPAADHTAWNTAGDDLMPAIYSTILFVCLALLVVGVMFASFCLMERSFYLRHPREALPKISEDW
jgi:hypothetical protein